MWLSITIEMDLSIIELERTLYTYFDLLSDVGGLSGILVTIITIILRVWNHNSLNNMMAADLFKVKKKTNLADSDRSLTPKDSKEYSDFLDQSTTPNCKELIISSLLPSCICCK